MTAVEAWWIARVGRLMCVCQSHFGLREPSSSDRSSVNIVMPVDAQR